MKKKFNYLMVLLAMILITSCEEEHGKASSLAINANVGETTRASKLNFIPGDEIGIFVKNTEDGNYNDCDCSFNNKSTLSTEWLLKENIQLTKKVGTVYAYYPYSSEVSDIKQVPISSSSQTDYLFSVPASVNSDSPVATLRMQHALSLVKFVIKKDGYSGEGHITEINLKNIGLSGSLNVMTGDIVTKTTGNEKYEAVFILNESTPLAIGLIAFPQVVSSTTALITIDGDQYSYKLAPSNWEKGKEITYTLKINQTEKTFISIGSATIDEWGSGGDYEGNLSGDGIDIGTEI